MQPDQPIRYKDLTSDQQALVETAMKAVDSYGAVCWEYAVAEEMGEGGDPDTTPEFEAARTALVQLLVRGIAEGLRQATEGWEREWGVSADAGVYVYPDQRAARETSLHSDWGRPVVSRLVGPWEPAEQPEPAREEARDA